MNKRNRLIMAASVVLAAGPASASGFGFYENGAKASAQGGAYVYAMFMQFDDVTANGSPADAVINGTYTSSILLAGVTTKYRF